MGPELRARWLAVAAELRHLGVDTLRDELDAMLRASGLRSRTDAVVRPEAIHAIVGVLPATVTLRPADLALEAVPLTPIPLGGTETAVGDLASTDRATVRALLVLLYLSFMGSWYVQPLSPAVREQLLATLPMLVAYLDGSLRR